MWSRVMAGVLVLVLVGSAGGPGTASAQGDDVRLIPVPGLAFNAVLAPGGDQVALYEVAALHEQLEVTYLPIRLIDLASGAETLLMGHTDYATGAAFTPDGAQLVTVHSNGEVIVWDVAARAVLHRYRTLPGGGQVIALADGVSVVVSLPGVTTAYAVWDLPSGMIARLVTPAYLTMNDYRALMQAGPPDRDFVFAAAPAGQHLVAGSIAGSVTLWDMATGEATVLIQSDDPRPMFHIRTVGYVLGGEAVAVYHQELETLRLFDPGDGTEIRSLPVSTRAAVALSPDGTLAAWVFEDAILVADLATGSIVAELALPAGDRQFRAAPPGNSGLLFTPDNRQIIVTGFIALETGENALAVIDLALP